MELTVPVIEKVRAAVFIDAGFVNAPSWSYGLNDMASDAGVGLRLDLPIGPLRLDYGIPITRDKYSECFEELRAGRVDAMTTDDVILLGLAMKDKRFALTGNPFRTEPYGIGVPKGDTELREFVNDALEDMVQSGEWASAFQSTVGTAGALVPAPPAIDRYE